MLKNLAFYALICSLVCLMLVTLLPYPTFSKGAFNLSQDDIAKINHASEKESYEINLDNDASQNLIWLDWTEAGAMMLANHPYAAIDLASENFMEIVRVGGHGHADVRGKQSKDRELLKTFAQEDKNRPLLINICENVWTCASLSTKQQLDKDGQVHYCLFFDQSRAHSTSLCDKSHQSTISLAYKRGKGALKKLQEQNSAAFIYDK